MGFRDDADAAPAGSWWWRELDDESLGRERTTTPLAQRLAKDVIRTLGAIEDPEQSLREHSAFLRLLKDPEAGVERQLVAGRRAAIEALEHQGRTLNEIAALSGETVRRTRQHKAARPAADPRVARAAHQAAMRARRVQAEAARAARVAQAQAWQVALDGGHMTREALCRAHHLTARQFRDRLLEARKATASVQVPTGS